MIYGTLVNNKPEERRRFDRNAVSIKPQPRAKWITRFLRWIRMTTKKETRK